MGLHPWIDRNSGGGSGEGTKVAATSRLDAHGRSWTRKGDGRHHRRRGNDSSPVGQARSGGNEAGVKRRSAAGAGGFGGYTPSGTFVLPLSFLSEEATLAQESESGGQGGKRQRPNESAEASYLEVSLGPKRARLRPCSSEAEASRRLAELKERVRKRLREPTTPATAASEETPGGPPCQGPSSVALSEEQKETIARNRRWAVERKRAKGNPRVAGLEPQQES